MDMMLEATDALVAKEHVQAGTLGNVSLCDMGYCSVGIDEVSGAALCMSCYRAIQCGLSEMLDYEQSFYTVISDTISLPLTFSLSSLVSGLGGLWCGY